MASYPELRDKTVLVTGGNTGIGAAIARAFGQQRSKLGVAGSRHPERTDAVVQQLRADGVEAHALSADVTRAAEVERMVAETTQRLGLVEVLVNCAGGFFGRKPLLEIDEAEWDLIVDLNLKSAYLCSRAVLPGMLERRWGRIVNISSEAGRSPVAFTASHYAAAKAGLLGLTRHLAREVADFGVTVNATAPSTTYSDRVRAITSPEVEARLLAITPIGRIASVDEQAGAVMFLASDAAAYITGATLDVSGGKIMM